LTIRVPSAVAEALQIKMAGRFLSNVWNILPVFFPSIGNFGVLPLAALLAVAWLQPLRCHSLRSLLCFRKARLSSVGSAVRVFRGLNPSCPPGAQAVTPAKIRPTILIRAYSCGSCLSWLKPCPHRISEVPRSSSSEFMSGWLSFFIKFPDSLPCGFGGVAEGTLI
jgi:hypothetical protein